MSDLITLAPAPRLPVLDADGASLGDFPVGRVFCVGRNYAEHAVEMGGNPDREPPFFFMKPASSVVHGRDPSYPQRTEDLHHEVELVVALGGTSGATIIGCGVGVDLTRRDLQAEMKAARRPWEAGKVFPDAAPCGALRAGHAVLAREHAEISLDVAGETRQLGRLDQMISGVPDILDGLRALFDLRPGDLVFTGTPAGVGPLLRGDRVRACIDGLPPLEFTMR